MHRLDPPARLLVLATALTLLGASCRLAPDERGFAPLDAHPSEPVVQLHAGDIPQIGAIAVHCWLVSYDPARRGWTRWEVWQTARDHDDSWGHLRRDLMSPGAWNRPHGVLAEWRGDDARRLQAVLRRMPDDYPYQRVYRYWPGPNSNTFPAWVAREAGVAIELPPRAIGKDYRGSWAGGITLANGRWGLAADALTCGVELGLRDGLQVHVLCLTFGVDLWSPAIITPFGRLGWPD